MRFFNRFFTGIIISIFLLTCKNEQPAKSPDKQTAAVSPGRVTPVFQRDTALAFVAKQVSFGPRVPNTPAHEQCKNWLVMKLKDFGAQVIEQNFQAKMYTGKSINGVNIIGQINPSARNRLVLAAHWDSRHIADSPLSTERKNEPILGADDGGSGVAVLLEIARQLHLDPNRPVNLGVDIVFFDAEDLGDPDGEDNKSWCLGSQYWAKNLHVNGYQPRYGILLDMVGARNARFPKEGYSMQIAPQLVNSIWDLAQSMGYGNYFDNAQAGAVTDDHFFVSTLARIPMIDIINLPLNPKNSSFGDHWHTHNDNLGVIDIRTLRAVGQVILEVLYREASGPS